MRVSLIAAMAQNLLIGTATGLPWHLPADLKRFRKLTMGKPVIVGRKTLELLGGPLPGRPHIVLTQQPAFRFEGCDIASSMETAIAKARLYLPSSGEAEVMVIGGAEVYRSALPFVTRQYLTIVEGEFVGDTYFPKNCLAGSGWTITHQEICPVDGKNIFPHRFEIWDRGSPVHDSGTHS